MKLSKILAVAVFAAFTAAAPAYAAVQGSVALAVKTADGKAKVRAAVKDVAWGGKDGVAQSKSGTVRITVEHGAIPTATLAQLQDDKVLIPELNLTVEDSAAPATYLKYKLDRCFVKSWSTSGDADVIEFGYKALEGGK